MGHRKRILAALRESTPGPVGSFPENPERRQFSVPFCGLVGYTDLSQRMDAEDLHDLLIAFHTTCREQIEHFEGFVSP